MTTAAKMISEGNREAVWNKYCGFLDLTITEYMQIQERLLLEPHVGIADLLAVSVIVIIVSVAASLQPAFKASRMEPIYALRHV